MTDPTTVPIAMFGITDWHAWGQALNRSGPVIGMPLACGVNPNYNGDAWANFTDSSNPMVIDHSIYFLISLGLNMPNGPTLTDASSGAMDQSWGNAGGCIRGAEGYGSPWTFPPLVEYRPSCIVRPGWEMTGDWYTWGMDTPDQVSTWAADFVAAYRRCVEVLRQTMPTPPSVGSVFNPNGDFATKQIDLTPFYPGDDVVDCCAIDIYDYPQWQGGLDSSGKPNLSGADRFAQFILPNLQAIDQFAASHSKTVGICEFGAGDSAGGDNPDFINGVADWCASAQSPVNFLGYWSGGSGSGYNGDLEQYPLQKAAFINRFKTP